MRLISVVGARPGFVKIAPLLPQLTRAGIDVDIAYTGTRCQPRPETTRPTKMTFYGAEVPAPRWFIDVGCVEDAGRTGRATAALESLFREQTPDAVLVIGDGDTTLAAAVAASKAGLPVIHLDAGLRSHDLDAPDEVNRVLISRLASMHLAPSEDAIENLEREGVDPGRIHFVGSMHAEAVLQQLDARAPSPACESYGVLPGHYVLASIRSSRTLCRAAALGDVMDGLRRTQRTVLVPDAGLLKRALERFAIETPPNVAILGPIPYSEMLELERDAAAIVTDSSGVQEEACVIRTPCITVRGATERFATVECGCNRLADTSAEALSGAIAEAAGAAGQWSVPKRWDRAVSDRVVRAIVRGSSGLH